MPRFAPLLAIHAVLALMCACCGGADDPAADVALDGIQTDAAVAPADDATASDALDTPDTAPPPLGPFGVPLTEDGVTRAGVARVDITPEIPETFTDLDGDHHFDGCLDDPSASRPECDEPFDDADGDGHFDAVWIGGFSPRRAAAGVHDPVEVRALALLHDGELLFLVGVDAVGILHYRLDQARDRLVAEDGLDPTRLVVASSHNHQGPDTFGIWGHTDLDAGQFSPGFTVAYQARVVDAIVEAVRSAAGALRPVELLMGSADMAGRSPWFDGRHFGGTNPNDRVQGLIRDIRDPVITSTLVFAMHARDLETGEGVASLLNFAGHPETWGSDNQLISSDWVGVARDEIDDALGGLTVFMPECLGGMQSTLGAPVPLVDAAGDWQWDGDVPVWAPAGTWEYVASVGRHIAGAALDALAGADVVTPEPFEVRRAEMAFLVDNPGWAFGATLGIADMHPSLIDTDPATCPGYQPADISLLGCITTPTWRIRLGPLGIITAPGELLPEVFHGLPEEDPDWVSESGDPGQRGTDEGRDSKWFPQHRAACDAVDWEVCRETSSVGDCDCLRLHASPYHHAPDPQSIPPLRSLLAADLTWRLATSATGSYVSYVVPANDFHRGVSLLSGPVGDHYEDSVSASSGLATALQEAQLGLGDDSP